MQFVSRLCGCLILSFHGRGVGVRSTNRLTQWGEVQHSGRVDYSWIQQCLVWLTSLGWLSCTHRMICCIISNSHAFISVTDNPIWLTCSRSFFTSAQTSCQSTPHRPYGIGYHGHLRPGEVKSDEMAFNTSSARLRDCPSHCLTDVLESWPVAACQDRDLDGATLTNKPVAWNVTLSSKTKLLTI